MQCDLSPHGLSCDGRGIAKDDLLAIEIMESHEECIHELFRNAARIHKAMRSNRLLIPIFRKYREVCREILQTKKEETEQLAKLSEYCDNSAHNPHQQKHDLNCIKSEMGEILNQINRMEEMQWTDDDDSYSECSSDCSDSENKDELCDDGGHEPSEPESEPDSEPESESESEPESESESDLSEVIEFLRQSQFE